ncbi:hypothetical protein FKW77_007352 [Venturia effusa]|uniref:Uncharacterized protein n=1 Tax=Venturia effusa TaxID=50376 RepID=A0A517LHK0_9PEZI|nr:hypothetical protein FKW77_007352 [Venturia effusa]
MSEDASIQLERGPIRRMEHLLPSPSLPQERMLRPSHEALLEVTTSNDGLLQPSTEADRIDIDVTGRVRSGTSSSKKMTIAYGPLEGDDTPDAGRNILKKSTHAVTPVEFYREDDERAINHKDRLWTPWTLRRWTLVALICFFSLSIVALEILSYVSKHQNGLSEQSQSRRFLWSYGPCAVFLLVAAVWHQIRYRTQQLMPWRTMAGGPTAASHSLLLDYVSSWGIISLFKSLRNGHLGVTLVILGSFLTKIVIAASTGLFSIQTRAVDRRYAPLQIMEQFGGTLDIDKISTSDAWVGLRNGSGLAWPTFGPTVRSNGTQNVTDTIDVFSADLTCEAAATMNVTSVECVQSNSSLCDLRWIFNAVTSSRSSCTFNDNMTWVTGWPSGMTGSRRFGLLSNASCDGNAADSGRLVITTGYLTSDSEEPDTQRFLNGTALICKPEASLTNKQVTLGKSGNILAVRDSVNKADTSLNTNAMSFADAVWRAANKSAPLRSAAFDDSDSFVDLISSFRPELNLDAHKDLEEGIRAIYRPIAAQIARTQLLVPADTAALDSSSSQTSADRLFVNAVSVRIMEVALGLLILITAALYFVRPAPSTPRDTSTMAGLATVMAQSPRYVATLQGLAAASYATIKEVVSASRYHSCVTDIDLVLQGEEQTFRISVDANDSESALEPSRAARAVAKPENWWVPIYDLTRVAVLVAIFIVLMVVELLHQRSKRDHGLGDADNSSPMRYAWTFVPAVVMLLLMSCIGIIDFATRLMQPYQALSRSPVPAQRSIFINYLSQFTVVAIWTAVTNAQFAVLFSAFAMLVAPFLTIVSTGLFVPTMLSHQAAMKIDMTSSINLNHTDAKAASQLSLLANSVIYGNSSWPAWTSDTLVLPSLSTSRQNTSEDSSISVLRMPVVYPRLECTRVPTSSILTSASTDTNKASMHNFSIPVAKGCGSSCSAADRNACNSNQDYVTLSSPVSQDGQLFGRVFLTQPSPASDGRDDDDCPRIGILYGNGWSGQGSFDELVGMICSPGIYQAEANATWSLPDWTVQDVAVDNSAERIIGKGDTATIDLNTILAKPESDNDFDSFFTALTQGRDSISAADLTAESNISTVQEKIQTLYARILAQSLSLTARSHSPSTRPPLKATLTTTSPRLIQDTTTTRILESLLALTFLSLVLASLCNDGRKLLPNNPCSIAVMSSLIADSEFVKKVVVEGGSEWVGDEELRRKGVFEGFVFSLGGWERVGGDGDEGGVRRVFGIDVGEAGAGG